jgi:hypothetical protein
VLEAAVVAREDSPGDKRLVAYIVSRDGAAPTSSRLREQLLGKLPEYMVPSAWVTLERLPLNPNGKIDRKALPPPAGQADEPQGDEAPRRELEQRLAAIWSQVLKVSRVGRHDNFFSLGGHSLLATQIVARMAAEELGQLGVRALFDAPTVAQLARIVDSLPACNSAASAPLSSIPRLARPVKT